MKSLLRSALGAISPRLLDRWATLRRRQRTEQIRRRVQPVLTEYVARHGHVIRAGPFEGLKYIEVSRGSVLLSKLMGLYERELFPWVTEINARAATPDGYDAVVDVGCAEGYYAVGFARALPGAQVYAFDIDTSAQALCARLAELNGVRDRVHVAGNCDHPALEALLARHARTLVVCDCEGFEDVLLDPVAAPGLRRADMLIEVHEFAAPGVTDRLLRRFASTHTLRRTPAVPIHIDEAPELADYDVPTREDALSEFRPPNMEWFYLSAHTT